MVEPTSTVELLLWRRLVSVVVGSSTTTEIDFSSDQLRN